MSPTTAAAPPLLDPVSFPPNVGAAICEQAGVQTRQASRAHRALHPPLLTLAPHGLASPTALQAALATLPPTPTSLDLRAIPVPLDSLPFTQPHPINPTTLAAIARTLPRLQRLLLPPVPATLLPSILHTLPSWPHLHTLSIPSLTHHHLRCHTQHAPQGPDWAPLLHPPTAARLRVLSLPASALPALHAAPPGSLPQLTSLTLTCHGGAPLDAAHLPALPSTLAPSLQSLHLLNAPCLLHPRHISTLRSLTAFTLTTTPTTLHPSSTAPALLLPPIATLTRLRALTLALPYPSPCPPASDAPHLLSRLTHLTHLHITLCCHPAAADPTAPPAPLPPPVAALMTALAAAASQLPLRNLHLAFSHYSRYTASAHSWPPCTDPSTFFHHLAAATQLRSLSLGNLPLPPAEACLLSSLQAFTSLRLHMCATPAGHSPTCGMGASQPPLQWVSALTNLQQLAWHEPWPVLDASMAPGGNAAPAPEAGTSLPSFDVLDDPSAPWQALASLPRLHTLDVDVHTLDVASRSLAGLLAALGGQLTRLQLGASKLAKWVPVAEPSAAAGCSRSAGATPGSTAGSAASSTAGTAAGCSNSTLSTLRGAVGGAGRGSTGSAASGCGSVLHALEAMAKLEVLELRGLEWQGKGAAPLQHLRLPASLRQVRVDQEVRGCALLEQLRAKHPLVVFRPVAVWDVSD